MNHISNDLFRRKIRPIFLHIGNLINQWTIARKIAFGYTVILGIIATGTISGLLIANHYEENAQNQLLISYQQQLLLKDLKNVVTTARMYPQKLINVIENYVLLDFEKENFSQEISQINKQLAELERFIKANPQSLAVNDEDFISIVNKYQATTQLYTATIQGFWRYIELNSLPNQTLNAVNSSQSVLLILLNDPEYVNLNLDFDKLTKQLDQIITNADQKREEANSNFNQAQKLRIKIIFNSILLSSIIAVILALVTTRLIARPLQAVTNTAKKITEESNFELRANVNTNDEVGILATSLNRLVEWVGDYTQQLEFARQTLEERVEERTQELRQAQHYLEERVEERTHELQQALQDLKNTQTQLIQTEKMSSLGEMVAGIAHEINNPVNFIYGNIQCAENYFQDLLDLLDLYQQEYPDQNAMIDDKIADMELEFLIKDISKLLSSMKIGSQRIREIVLSLRNFSRLDEAEMKDVDIHEGIDNTLLLLRYKLNHADANIHIIQNYGDLPLISCYPAQLNQVFMNIITNAIDALTECENKEDKDIVITTSKVNEEYLQVGIKDNGIGIAEEVRNKLFDPFFTTKPVGKGTGLGLSICYQIIQKHQGKIEVFSQVGEGTEFLITLPIKH
jgi:signal transduction histidine kinase